MNFSPADQLVFVSVSERAAERLPHQIDHSTAALKSTREIVALQHPPILEKTKVLVAYGADVNPRTEDGHHGTVLQLAKGEAAKSTQDDLQVDLLIEHGAHDDEDDPRWPEVVNKRNRTHSKNHLQGFRMIYDDCAHERSLRR